MGNGVSRVGVGQLRGILATRHLTVPHPNLDDLPIPEGPLPKPRSQALRNASERHYVSKRNDA